MVTTRCVACIPTRLPYIHGYIQRCLTKNGSGLMEIEFVLLADAVDYVNGKLYVLGGGWRQFKSPNFPAVARIGLAVSIIVGADQPASSSVIRIRFGERGVDPADLTTLSLPFGSAPASVVEIQAQLQVTPLDPSAPQRAFVAFNSAFPIPRVGMYEITAALDGSEPKRIDFEAISVLPTSSSSRALN
jgi:hypothetical protein